MDFFFRASFESVPSDAVFPCAPEADSPVDDAFSDTVFPDAGCGRLFI